MHFSPSTKHSQMYNRTRCFYCNNKYNPRKFIHHASYQTYHMWVIVLCASDKHKQQESNRFYICPCRDNYINIFDMTEGSLDRQDIYQGAGSPWSRYHSEWRMFISSMICYLRRTDVYSARVHICIASYKYNKKRNRTYISFGQIAFGFDLLITA